MSEPLMPRWRGGVVLIPCSWSGDNEAFSALLSEAGFTVLVPQLVAEASDPEVIRALTAARDQLPPGPRFVVGMGDSGVHARIAACAVLGLAGAVSFGGRISYAGVNARQPIQPMDLLPGLSCPLQCHFATDDPAAPATHVDELSRRLAGTSQPWQLFRYGASTNVGIPDGSRIAWARATSFLMHLAAERA